jgi:hypothetical protein
MDSAGDLFTGARAFGKISKVPQHVHRVFD